MVKVVHLDVHIQVALHSKRPTYKEIYTSICKKGCAGSEATIRQFIAKEKSLQSNQEDDVIASSTEIMGRKWLVKLLYKPLNQVKAISQEQVKKRCREISISRDITSNDWALQKYSSIGR